jgi:hypothetical protein
MADSRRLHPEGGMPKPTVVLADGAWADGSGGRWERATALSEREEPGPAFFTFIALVVDRASSKNAFADALAAAGVNAPAVASGV